MSDDEQTLLSPLKLILFVAADSRIVHNELAGKIKTLNALLQDRGKNMSVEMRTRWIRSATKAASDCDQNRYGMSAETLKLCAMGMSALRGRFCEIVEQDHLMAARYYEEAAKAVGYALLGLTEIIRSVKRGTKMQQEVDEKSPLYEQVEAIEQWSEVVPENWTAC